MHDHNAAKTKAKSLRAVIEDIVLENADKASTQASIKQEVEERYAFVQSVFDKFIEQVKFQPIRIKNFGTLFVFEGKPMARNPKTGEVVEVKEPLSLKMKTSTKANEEINRN